MASLFQASIPVLPAFDVAASLRWWTELGGFAEEFRHGEPPIYAGVVRGGARVHLSLITDAALARAVGGQSMTRLQVTAVEEFCAEYRQRGGAVHPNGGLARKPWGSLEFAATDPCGVCVSFFE